MRPLSPNAIEDKNNVVGKFPWVWLYEVEVPTTPATRFRLTPHMDFSANGITFEGNLYYPCAVVHTSPEESTEANLPEITLQVQNISREVGGYLSLYGGLVDAPVRVLLVYYGDIAAGPAVLDDTWSVLDAEMTAKAVTLRLGVDGLYRQQIPGRRMMRNFCSFLYRSAECGYSILPTDGGLATCSKSLDGTDGCEAHGENELSLGYTVQHPARIGAYPAIVRMPGSQGGGI